MLLSDVYLSRTSGLTREQRGPGRLKLAQRSLRHTWLGHHFQGQRSRLPGRFAHRRVGASGGCSGGRGNVLAVGNCCYVVVCSAAQCASAPTEGGEGRGHTVAVARLQPVSFIFAWSNRSHLQIGINYSSIYYKACRQLVIFYPLNK